MATIGLVVGDKTSLTVSDTTLKALFEGEGHTVTPIGDEEAVPTSGIDLFYITESCSTSSATGLGTKYQNLAVPTISMEVGGWNELLWTTTAPTLLDGVLDVDHWDNQPHDITTGLPDPLTIYGQTDPMYGFPSPVSVPVSPRWPSIRYRPTTLWRSPMTSEACSATARRWWRPDRWG